MAADNAGNINGIWRMNAIVPQRGSALAPAAGRGRGGKDRGLTPEQKAAVIISMLGEGAAKPLLEKMGDEQVAKVLHAFENLDKISREDQAYIVRDFLQGLRATQGSFRGGPEEAKKMAEALIDSERYQRLFGDGAGQDGDDTPQTSQAVWARLQEKDPEELAEYLENQPPKITALVLQKLGAEFAARILKILPEEKATAIILKLTDNQPVKPRVLDSIARLLETDILNAKKTSQKKVTYEHLEPVAEVLSLLPIEKQKKMMDFLQGNDADMADAIKKSMITVEDIPETLPRNAVPVIFREMEEGFIRKVLKVLEKTNGPVVEYLLANISKRMVEQIKEDMEALEAIEAEEEDDILTEFLTQIMALQKAELITLNR